MARWAVSRRAISCANAVRAVSENDCWVLKFVTLSRKGGSQEEPGSVVVGSGVSVASSWSLGW